MGDRVRQVGDFRSMVAVQGVHRDQLDTIIIIKRDGRITVNLPVVNIRKMEIKDLIINLAKITWHILKAEEVTTQTTNLIIKQVGYNKISTTTATISNIGLNPGKEEMTATVAIIMRIGNQRVRNNTRTQDMTNTSHLIKLSPCLKSSESSSNPSTIRMR